MLKKIKHILISVAILLATTGMTISQHYCMGQLQEVSLNAMEDLQCEMATRDNCDHCENHELQLKISDNFLISSHDKLPSISLTLLIAPITPHNIISPNTIAQEQSAIEEDRKPPPSSLKLQSALQCFLL